jgi:hypothetical protein
MTALEIKILAFVVIFAIFGVVCWHDGYKKGLAFKTAEWNIDKLAQAKLLEQTQAERFAALQARDIAQANAEKADAIMDAQNDALVAADASRMHSISPQILGCALSKSVGDTSKLVGSPAVPASDAEAQSRLRQLEQDISDAESAGYHDATELNAILGLAPK